MDREQADHQVWQHKPFRFRVEADTFLAVSPCLPSDVFITPCEGGIEIHGTYGFDTYRDDRFLLLVDGKLQTYNRWEDIPERFDNVIDFAPDPAHDLTFSYRFKRGDEVVTQTHWVHHDMKPWEDRLRELVSRETNGGWDASSYTTRGRRHSALLGDGEDAALAKRLLQQHPDQSST